MERIVHGDSVVAPISVRLELEKPLLPFMCFVTTLAAIALVAILFRQQGHKPPPVPVAPKCANKRCQFSVTNPDWMGGFCCKWCYHQWQNITPVFIPP